MDEGKINHFSRLFIKTVFGSIYTKEGSGHFVAEEVNMVVKGWCFIKMNA